MRVERYPWLTTQTLPFGAAATPVGRWNCLLSSSATPRERRRTLAMPRQGPRSGWRARPLPSSEAKRAAMGERDDASATARLLACGGSRSMKSASWRRQSSLHQCPPPSSIRQAYREEPSGKATSTPWTVPSRLLTNVIRVSSMPKSGSVKAARATGGAPPRRTLRFPPATVKRRSGPAAPRYRPGVRGEGLKRGVERLRPRRFVVGQELPSVGGAFPDDRDVGHLHRPSGVVQGDTREVVVPGGHRESAGEDVESRRVRHHVPAGEFTLRLVGLGCSTGSAVAVEGYLGIIEEWPVCRREVRLAPGRIHRVQDGRDAGDGGPRASRVSNRHVPPARSNDHRVASMASPLRLALLGSPAGNFRRATCRAHRRIIRRQRSRSPRHDGSMPASWS